MDNHVSMEQHACIVCGKTYDTGSILLARRYHRDHRTGQLEPLKPMKRHTVTGYGMCPEHQKLKDDGFVALIAVDPSKSRINANMVAKSSDAYRTGDIAHLHRDAWVKVFDSPVPDKMVCFVEPLVIDMLQKMKEGADGTPAT